MAVARLEPQLRLNPVMGIALGREYGQHDWLRNAFKSLILSWESIDKPTGEDIGLPTLVSLMNLRDKVWRYRVDNNIKYGSSYDYCMMSYGQDRSSPSERRFIFFASLPRGTGV